MKTRLTLYTIACIFFTWQAAIAQHCSDVKGFSTNPDDPVNPDGACGVLNDFDWRKTQFPAYNISGQFLNHNTPYGQITAFSDDQSDSYLDYHPEDGWELIQASEYYLPAQEGGHVYFILYNKFGSFLRIFFTLEAPSASNFINVFLRFTPSSDYTALFHPSARGYNQPLDSTSESSIRTTVKATNQYGKYMYVDIPVEYDPCSCGAGSTLELEFQTVQNQKIDLAGRFWELNRTLAEINETGTPTFDEDYLLGVFDAASYEDVLATQTFDTFIKLDSFYSSLKDENDALKEKYNSIVAIEDAVEFIATAGKPILSSMKILDSASIFGISGIDMSGSDALGIFSAGLKYYSKRLKRDLESSSGKLNRVGGSSISNGEMALTGNISTFTPLSGAHQLKLPGSLSTSLCSGNYDFQFNQYPRYNEILGRFALLETPKVKMDVMIFAPTHVEVLLQLDITSFKYVFNPAVVNPTGTKIWGMIEYEAGEPSVWSYNMNPYLITSENSIHTTPVLPIECLGEFIGYILGGIGLPSNARLKLFVDYEFYNGDRGLQVYSYPLEMEATIHNPPPLKIGTANPNPNFYTFTPAYQDFLEISESYFEGPLHGFEESQLIFAWSGIKIDGDLTAAPGVKVEIVAPNITLTDGATIGSDILLRNSFAPFASCEPKEEVTSADLADFCESSTYQARFASYTIPEEESALLAARAEEEARQEQASRQAIALRAFPNPLEDFGTLEFVLPADMTVSAYLSDMHGQRLQELVSPRDLPAGRHLFDLTLVNLPPGMYLLTLQTPEGPQTVKLVRL